MSKGMPAKTTASSGAKKGKTDLNTPFKDAIMKKGK